MWNPKFNYFVSSRNKMPKVLITGASGLLGRALVLEFSKNSWDVCGLAFSRAKNNLVKVDLNATEEVKKIIENFKVLINLLNWNRKRAYYQYYLSVQVLVCCSALTNLTFNY